MKFINFKLLIIFFSFCFTQSVKMVISDINVFGLERLSKEDIFRISKLYPESEIVRGDEINKAINRLWDIGRFSDIQIFADEQIDNKISINIKLLLEIVSYLNCSDFFTDDIPDNKNIIEHWLFLIRYSILSLLTFILLNNFILF